jgi:hypothetical protein
MGCNRTSKETDVFFDQKYGTDNSSPDRMRPLVVSIRPPNRLQSRTGVNLASPVITSTSISQVLRYSLMADLSSEDRAIRVICTKGFHQALWLPETVHHPKLKVTFSTTTNFDNIDLPVILFVGPMFGTRYNSLHFDRLARDSSVRLICVDR